MDLPKELSLANLDLIIKPSKIVGTSKVHHLFFLGLSAGFRGR